MDIKWKRSRAAAGFLAFFCGVTLILSSLMFLGGNLAYQSGRQWATDSLQADWRDSYQVREYLAQRLVLLSRMGSGSLSTYYSDGGGYRSGHALLEQWAGDKNLLYYVNNDSSVYSNSNFSVRPLTGVANVPDGYGLVLHFDGAKVRIWKDGTELDVYGDGYLDFEDMSQWRVPGYENYPAPENSASVILALIDQPRVFTRNGTQQSSEIYSLWNELQYTRGQYIRCFVRLGIGVALVAVYLLLRKDKKRADQFLARGTGKIWFEVKAAALVLLAVLLLPRTGLLTQVWQEVSIAYGTYDAPTVVGSFEPMSEAELVEIYGLSSPAEVEEYQALFGSGGVTYISPDIALSSPAYLLDQSGWLLKEWLVELSQYPARLLTLFWAFYLLLVNDWRYNKKPWKYGLGAMLTAWDLSSPVQKRLSRAAGVTALAVVVPVGLLLWLVIVICVNYSRRSAALVWCLFAVAVLFAALAILFIRRLRRLWTDLEAVSAQVSAIRAGGLEQKLVLPERSDLRGMADDLNHIQQGLHQAVEERTRSERMKVELVTNVSHDLKTPLTSILSYAELLEREKLEPPAGEYAKILGEKARRLTSMVQDVFEVSKAASGQLPVKLERLDYARLLRQTLADMDGAIADSGLTLRAAIPDEPMFITADSDRLYRVFQNLLGNALKYSLAGSRVYLALDVEGGRAVATLRNTSADELKEGTDYTARFVRGDESRTDGGSGLGLSIADSFTRACGGELSISTQADLFTARVSFPCAQT